MNRLVLLLPLLALAAAPARAEFVVTNGAPVLRPEPPYVSCGYEEQRPNASAWRFSVSDAKPSPDGQFTAMVFAAGHEDHDWCARWLELRYPDGQSLWLGSSARGIGVKWWTTQIGPVLSIENDQDTHFSESIVLRPLGDRAADGFDVLYRTTDTTDSALPLVEHSYTEVEDISVDGILTLRHVWDYAPKQSGTGSGIWRIPLFLGRAIDPSMNSESSAEVATNAPAAPDTPAPFPPLASFAPAAPDKGGLFRPGLLEELRGFRRVVPGPVQALANKNGVVAEPENALSLNGLHSFGEVFPVIVDRTPAEAAQWSRFARSWESGDIYRYRGQVFATKDGDVRFGERMWDFTTVKLDGRPVFESREFKTADCSYAIPVKAGWHEIEIVFENENGRAGAAWPDYVDKGVPTGPGFGIAKDASKASTDPADYTFPADIGDGSVFRVPVEGAPIRVTAVRENQGAEVDIEYDELPAEAEITIFARTDFGEGKQEGATIPAGKKGKMTISYVYKLKFYSVRLRATMPNANLVWWSDVLLP